MINLHDYLSWVKNEAVVRGTVRRMWEMGLNPVWVFHHIFVEKVDPAELFAKLTEYTAAVPGTPVGTPPSNPQQLQQFTSLVQQFMKNRTGDAGFDAAIGNVNTQLNLMQQKQKQPQPQPQPSPTNPAAQPTTPSTLQQPAGQPSQKTT